MKKLFVLFIALACMPCAFAQQYLQSVAVATFDTMGGITADESQMITELFIAQLVDNGNLKVVDRENFDKILKEMKFQNSDWSDSKKTAELGKAISADFIIRGKLMKLGEIIYMTSTMIDVKTAQIVTSSKLEINTLNNIFSKLPDYVSELANKMPKPNYFVGKWKTGGRLYSNGTGWYDTKDLSPFNSSIINNSDDTITEIWCFPDFSCIIFENTTQKKGSYSYDASSSQISIISENSSIYSGKVTFAEKNTTAYILYDIQKFFDYKPFYKILIRYDDLYGSANDENYEVKKHPDELVGKWKAIDLETFSKFGKQISRKCEFTLNKDGSISNFNLVSTVFSAPDETAEKIAPKNYFKKHLNANEFTNGNGLWKINDEGELCIEIFATTGKKDSYETLDENKNFSLIQKDETSYSLNKNFTFQLSDNKKILKIYGKNNAADGICVDSARTVGIENNIDGEYLKTNYILKDIYTYANTFQKQD